MKNYLELIDHVLTHGTRTRNRTGVDTISVFAPPIQFRHDLSEGFPLVTVKRTPFYQVLKELLWFLSGSTNARDLEARGCKIWSANAHPETGELGPIYSKQWRAWNVPAREPTNDDIRHLASDLSIHSDGTADDNFGFVEGWASAFCQKGKIDQIKGIVRDLRTNPDSRRIILSAWNVADIPKMRLPPCHVLAHFRSELDYGECNTCGYHLDTEVCHNCNNVKQETPLRRLSCHMYQRSADLFLGVPFNIASYALLTRMLALTTGHYPGKLVITYGDLHLYVADNGDPRDQVANARELLKREPKPLPGLYVRPRTSMDEYVEEDFNLLNYESHPALKSEMVV